MLARPRDAKMLQEEKEHSIPEKLLLDALGVMTPLALHYLTPQDNESFPILRSRYSLFHDGTNYEAYEKVKNFIHANRIFSEVGFRYNLRADDEGACLISPCLPVYHPLNDKGRYYAYQIVVANRHNIQEHKYLMSVEIPYYLRIHPETSGYITIYESNGVLNPLRRRDDLTAYLDITGNLKIGAINSPEVVQAAQQGASQTVGDLADVQLPGRRSFEHK